MTTHAFLAPVLALIIWTILVCQLMGIRRVREMLTSKVDLESAKSPDGAWKEALPLKVQAAAHNYNHLLEQPTLFYALMFYATLAGQISYALHYAAWVYVALRVIHSLVQISAGKVILRFSVFVLSTVTLTIMVILNLI